MANIWLAAGEGSFDKVKEYVEQGGVSPNAKDDNSYTPLHAAASWNHPDILRYLVEHGGDINITDDDGDTPLYVVENVGIARLVVELGGDPNWRNEEGVTPAEALQDEHPHISVFLRTLSGLGESDAASTPADSTSPDVDAPTDELMAAVRTIMEASQRGELTEAETDDKLREVVEQIVEGQVEAGRAIGANMTEGDAATSRDREETGDEEGEAKRPRESIGR
ncbi:hypothetical protein JCM10212_002528 [Sporobolomyces blumeae]